MAKVENMGVERLVKALNSLNPTGNFCALGWDAILVTGRIDPREIKCPEGYYLSEKNGLTNKHNTESGIYESFHLV